MTVRPLRLALAALSALLASAPAPALADDGDSFRLLLPFEQDPREVAIGSIVPDLTMKDLTGATRPLSAALKDRRAVVLCLTSVTCPLSTRYTPRQKVMADEYAARGVLFVLVNVSDTDTLPEMKQQAKMLQWPGLSLPDEDRSLRRALSPRTTTEVLVIDAARTLVFRGAVDDQFGVGSATAEPKRRWLRDALDAVIAGRPVATPATWSPGCTVDPAPAQPVDRPDAAVTYANRVARIVRERCESCHFYGGPAPFSLENYRAVAGRASMISAVVRAGLMPPWDAAPPENGAPSPWKHDPSLTADEKRDLLSWLDSERPQGDMSEAPAPIKRVPGWQIGAPDLMMISENVVLPADGPLVFSRLVVDTRLAQPMWIAGVEMMARKRMSLHHAVLFLQTAPFAEGQSDAEAMRAGALTPILAAGAAHSAAIYPEGSGRLIPAGAKLVIHAWFRPGGKPMSEKLRPAFKALKQPPALEVRSAPILADADAPGAARVGEAMLPAAASVFAFTPTPGLRAQGLSLSLKGLAPAPKFTSSRFRAAWPVRYQPLTPWDLAAETLARFTATPVEEPAAGSASQTVALLGIVEYTVQRPE